jgi:hypothetical protein
VEELARVTDTQDDKQGSGRGRRSFLSAMDAKKHDAGDATLQVGVNLQ